VNRALTLTKLSYGYNGNAVTTNDLYNGMARPSPYRSSSVTTMEWNAASKHFRIELLLKLGAVQELMYRATMQLCSVGTGTTIVGNTCPTP